jgi:hypothetical protein
MKILIDCLEDSRNSPGVRLTLLAPAERKLDPGIRSRERALIEIYRAHVNVCPSGRNLVFASTYCLRMHNNESIFCARHRGK